MSGLVPKLTEHSFLIAFFFFLPQFNDFEVLGLRIPPERLL